MWRWIAIACMGLLFCGCGKAAQESGFWDHPSVYKNWDHLKYSWYGYKNPTAQTGKESQEQGWWGIEVKAPEE